jgi:pimeloyl-ACP methyl ester carboxylesterase
MLLEHPSVKRVVLVDWLGMGGSDRPQCGQRPIRGFFGSASSSWCDSRFTPSQAVDFFVDPFHEWMQASVKQKEDITRSSAREDRIVLVGHSLGGYLASQYVLRYSQYHCISKLVLASPVGFPEIPKNALRGSHLPTSFRVVDALWSSNITPQQLVRMMGSTRGRRNTKRALKGRIPHLADTNSDLLADYLYHITVAAPSGEFAMNSLMEPAASPETMGVFAREPLSRRLVDLEHVDTVKVLFGDHDWMRPNEPSARETLASLQQRRRVEAGVEIVSHAGHHLYLDNPIEFTRHVLD